MKKWLTTRMNTIVGIARKNGIVKHPFARLVGVQWSDLLTRIYDRKRGGSRCDWDNIRWSHDNGRVCLHVDPYNPTEVDQTMAKDTVENNAFGVNGSVQRETSKENGMVSTCIFRDDNPEAWIEITFQHNDAEMRHFRY